MQTARPMVIRPALMLLAAGLGVGGCSTGGAGRGATAGVPARDIVLHATAIRVTGQGGSASAYESLLSEPDRLAKALPVGGQAELMTQLDALGDVEVLAQPSVRLSPETPGRLRFQTATPSDHKDRGFLMGMHTKVGLWVQPTIISRDEARLAFSGSVLQFTPDEGGATLHENAVYTRLRDFEAETGVRDRQPLVLGGPLLREEGDGGWTAVVLVLTPEFVEPGAGAALAAVSE